MPRARKSKTEPLSDEAYAALIAEVTRPKSPDEKRFIKLGWEILEAKFRYYVLDDPRLSDSQYDAMEREYIALGIKLGEPEKRGLKDPGDIVSVDFPWHRPAAQLVADRVQDRDPSGYYDTLAKKIKG